MSESKKNETVDKSKDAGTNGTTDLSNKTSQAEMSGDSSASYLFDRVFFQKENIILGWSIQGDKVYDTILW